MNRIIRIVLLALEGFVSLTAIAGGIALIVTNGMGMPTTWLRGSPFSSYLIPGLVLAMVVGGANTLAAGMIFAKHQTGLLASLAAGIFIISFEMVEMAVIQQFSWLQALYLVLGLAILLLAIWLWQATNRQPAQAPLPTEENRPLVDSLK